MCGTLCISLVIMHRKYMGACGNDFTAHGYVQGPRAALLPPPVGEAGAAITPRPALCYIHGESIDQYRSYWSMSTENTSLHEQSLSYAYAVRS